MKKTVCLCVTLSVGTAFLYLNNNQWSLNFTGVFLIITPRDVFFFIGLQVVSQIFHLYNIIILSKNFWSCQTLFLRHPRLTDHKNSQFFFNLYSYKIFQHLAQFSNFQKFCIFFLFVSRLIGPYESPNFLIFSIHIF